MAGQTRVEHQAKPRLYLSSSQMAPAGPGDRLRYGQTEFESARGDGRSRSARRRGLPEPEAFAPIPPGEHGLAPLSVLEVPLDGGAKARVEGARGPPAQLATEPARIDRVAAVVARPIGDERLELGVAGDPPRPESRVEGGRPERLQGRADGVDDLEVRPLVVAADVVARPGLPRPQHQPERGAVVLDVEPVPHVPAVPVDGQRAPVDGVERHQGNQLL